MKHIHGFENGFGGSDYFDDNGNYVGSSMPGIGGGEDFTGTNGETGFSVDAVFGNGQNLFFSDGKMAYSVDGLFGGKNIYGNVSGFSISSPSGGSDLFIEGEDE